MNQLLNKIKDSLLKNKKLFFSFGKYLKRMINDIDIIKVRKISIKRPLDGSLAKVWTEFNIPDLTKKVPVTLIMNVRILKIKTQAYNPFFLSKMALYKSLFNH